MKRYAYVSTEVKKPAPRGVSTKRAIAPMRYGEFSNTEIVKIIKARIKNQKNDHPRINKS